ncbi:hypothetical protein BTA51_27525 [Hahella sp. CCB-MM4]|uniref:DUF349 domain-containing protein n=1 Tax=Hahella sp. (strain CCB-MM4) TaxID=1926491 RepID=UPI000B9A6868|nr:DUF349 domain-containing protein [Hahella sp. CCB-MM4]OZG70124.1 hypothetical protein BTA51_27525 [Hahella sp. CCB-MM4]
MLLKKIFKPKWQSNNPDVRKEAITQLDWGKSEDKAILEQLIKHETDDTVLKAALKRVLSVTDLIDLAQSTDKARQAAHNRVLEILAETSTNFDSFLGQHLQRISQDLAFDLATGLKSSDNLHLFLQSLHLHAPDTVLELAINHPLSLIRQKAAELIVDPEKLSILVSRTKGKDKGVFQKAKSRLQAYKDQEQAKLAHERELQSLCDSLEQHAATEATKYYTEKLEALIRSLAKFDLGQHQEHQDRIERALQTCKSRANQIAEQEAREHQIVEEARLQSGEREETCQELEKTREKLKSTPLTQQSELSALDALIKTQENRWLEATRHQRVDKTEQKRYQHVMTEIRHYHIALQRLFSHQSELSDKLEQARSAADADPVERKTLVKSLRQMVTDIEWPSDYNLHPLLQAVSEAVGEIQTLQTRHIEDIGKFKDKVRKDLDELEKAISQGEVKKAQRLTKDANRDLEHLPGKQKQDLQARLKMLLSQLDELRDWQGFATRPKQEELCEHMEHLAEQHLEPHIKANKIKELQKEWRDLGGSSDQHLWQRFKHASDNAYAPCKAYFSEEEKLKQVNLDKRESICTELATFIEAIDWDQPDWKLVDKINRKAREEWRQYYPVDHKKGKPVQTRFNELLTELDTKLNKEKERNHKLKQEIVSRAEALVSEEDLKQATHQAKDLQKEWQQVGITDHKTDRQLWGQFRKACDEIFGRIGEQRKQHQEEISHNQDKANELITAVEALAASPDSGTDTALSTLIDQYRSLGSLGDQTKSLGQRFHKAIDTVEKGLQQLRISGFVDYYSQLLECAKSFGAGGTIEWPASIDELDQHHHELLASRQNAESGKEKASADTLKDIVILAEILAEIDSPQEDKERRMALQVERLTAGLQQSASDASSPSSRFDGLIQQWLTAIPDEQAASDLNELTERFKRTLNNIAQTVARS